MFSKSQERVIKIVYVLAFVLTFVPTNLLFVGWYPVSIGPNCKLESFIGLDVYPEHLALLNIDAGPLSPKIMSGVYIFLFDPQKYCHRWGGGQIICLDKKNN